MTGPTDASETGSGRRRVWPLRRQPRTARRGGFQPRAIVAVMLVWLLLWDQVTLGNIVNGLLIGAVVTLVFPLPALEFAGWPRPHRVGLVVYWFLHDLVISSFQVAFLAFSRRPFKNAVIEVNLRSRSDFYLTITAELVALVPGSVVVDARRSTSTLYLHLLDVDPDGGMERMRQHVLQIERRVVRAFGSRAEIDDLERKAREEKELP